jgi:broad specificity phosphatase PhoE
MSEQLGWPTELYLVRHGQSHSQKALSEGKGQRLPQEARSNAPLSDLGRRQAEALGLHWRNQSFPAPDTIVCTRKIRTHETAEAARAVAGRQHVQIVEHEGFDEQNCGDLVGLSDQMIVELYPQDASRKVRQGWWLFRAPGGGESWEDVVLRLHPAFAWLRSQFAGQRVVLVGHVVMFQCARLVLESMTPADLLAIDICPIPNCNITTYRHQEGQGLVLSGEPYFLPAEVAALTAKH